MQANGRSGRGGTPAAPPVPLVVARCRTGDQGSELELDCAVARATVSHLFVECFRHFYSSSVLSDPWQRAGA